MFHFLVTNLESFGLFNKSNTLRCSIIYIILLQLKNLTKSLEYFFAAFQQ